MVDTVKKIYESEHTLFTFVPVDNIDYELWEDEHISKKITNYTDWFKNNKVPAKKYTFKKYVNPGVDGITGYVTVKIFDRKIDALFRLTWL